MVLAGPVGCRRSGGLRGAFALGRGRAIVPVPRLLGNLGNLFIQTVLLPGIWDTQCGFKAFREEAVEEIFPMLTIDRWGFDIEILSLARAQGYRIKEVPVVWVNDPHSHVKPTAYLQVLWETITIRWRLYRGRYPLRHPALPENAGV